MIVEAFATITSPVFSELTLDLREDEISRLPSDVAFFETLRKANEIRPFKLVFVLGVLNSYPKDIRCRFAEVLDQVTVKGYLNFLDYPPSIPPVCWA